MLHRRDDYINYTDVVECQECNAKLDVWIGHIPQIQSLCPDCALKIGRRLIEDVLSFHNNKHVSLLGIMRHGEKSTNDHVAGEQLGLVSAKKHKMLFDF